MSKYLTQEERDYICRQDLGPILEANGYIKTTSWNGDKNASYSKGDGTKIQTQLNGNGVWTFVKANDSHTKGLAWDLMAHISGKSLDDCKTACREFYRTRNMAPELIKSGIAKASETTKNEPMKPKFDPDSYFRKHKELQNNGKSDRHLVNGVPKYLVETRGIDPAIVKAFGRNISVQCTDLGGTMAAHRNPNDIEKITGFEIKNKNADGSTFTMFSSDSKKAFAMMGQREPKNIVIAESFIDALSYADLNSKSLDFKELGLWSTAGTCSTKQLAMLTEYCNAHRDCRVTLAFDNDPAGLEKGDILKDLLAISSPHTQVEITLPRGNHKDFNDELRGKPLEIIKKSDNIFERLNNLSPLEKKQIAELNSDYIKDQQTFTMADCKI